MCGTWVSPFLLSMLFLCSVYAVFNYSMMRGGSFVVLSSWCRRCFLNLAMASPFLTLGSFLLQFFFFLCFPCYWKEILLLVFISLVFSDSWVYLGISTVTLTITLSVFLFDCFHSSELVVFNLRQPVLSFSYKTILCIILYIWIFCPHMCLLPSELRRRHRILWNLMLYKVLGCHVGTRSPVLWKNSQCCYGLNHLFSTCSLLGPVNWWEFVRSFLFDLLMFLFKVHWFPSFPFNPVATKL